MNVVRANLPPSAISTVWIRLELAKLVFTALLHVSFKTSIPSKGIVLTKVHFQMHKKVRYEENNC